MGIDIKAILSSAQQIQNSCNGVPAASNPERFRCGTGYLPKELS